MRLIILGAPGAGKGTQAGIISRTLDIPVISTGNILRAAIKEGTPLGTKAQAIIQKGELVPDDIIIDLVRERLKENDCAGGYILDGAPRTIPQAEALEANGIVIDFALSFELPDEILRERIAGRRVCQDCNETFHVINNPPKVEGVCDRCGGRLIQREDDLPETADKRLEIYRRETAPLIDFYTARGKLKTILTQGSPDYVNRLIVEALGLELPAHEA